MNILKDLTDYIVEQWWLLVAIIIGALINGLVIMILWAWFIVPIFHQPNLQFIQASGLALFMLYVFNGKVDDIDVDNKNLLKNLIVVPILCIAAGWILHLFL